MTVAAPASLSPQLALLKQELLLAREAARFATRGLSANTWEARPAPGQWSIAECLIHLNITSERFIPLIDEAIRDGRARRLEKDGPYGLGFMGWLLLRVIEPPYRRKTKTAPPFVPEHIEPMSDVLERFDYLQQELQVRVERSSGLALDKLRIVSPFDARVKYNLYAALCILAAHQRRHLWQAEQVRLHIL